MIKIICIGKLKENYLKQAQTEYLKRITKYVKTEIIELEDEKDNNINISLSKERDKILKHIKPKDNIILLDINGKEFTSIELSNYINKEITYNNNITFIIGSSNGLHNDIKKLTSKKLSFSKLTFPHQLFRILLLEQLYRSYKIINNESYHK